MNHAEKVQLLCAISDFAIHMQPVGSCVTCNPPSMDTDEDFLILVDIYPDEYALYFDDKPKLTPMIEVTSWFNSNGFQIGGSLPTDLMQSVPKDEQFWSWTREELNIIVTRSEAFYNRFMAATAVSKRLNLLNKPDRIALFQAVLYGNPCDADSDS